MLHQPDVPHLLNIVSIWRQRSVILETEQQIKQVLEKRALSIDLRIKDIKSSHNREAPGISKFLFFSPLERASKFWASKRRQHVSVKRIPEDHRRRARRETLAPSRMVSPEQPKSHNGKTSLKVRRSRVRHPLFPLLVIAASRRDGEEWNCSC